jgi:hypothetical protein
VDFFDMVSEDDFKKAIRESAEVNRGLDELAAEVKRIGRRSRRKTPGTMRAHTKVRKKKDKRRDPDAAGVE